MHQSTQLHHRVLHGAFVRLERSAVKVACSVLRGLGEGDLAWLPGGVPSASQREKPKDDSLIFTKHEE